MFRSNERFRIRNASLYPLSKKRDLPEVSLASVGFVNTKSQLLTGNCCTMKAKLSLITALLIMISISLYAQNGYKKIKSPRWVSEKGFWQIQSNINRPDRNIVYFYNNENVLVYKENVDGVVFDLQKKRVKMRLKRALEAAILAWNRDRVFQDNQQWISLLFR